MPQYQEIVTKPVIGIRPTIDGRRGGLRTDPCWLAHTGGRRGRR